MLALYFLQKSKGRARKSSTEKYTSSPPRQDTRPVKKSHTKKKARRSGRPPIYRWASCSPSTAFIHAADIYSGTARTAKLMRERFIPLPYTGIHTWILVYMLPLFFPVGILFCRLVLIHKNYARE